MNRRLRVVRQGRIAFREAQTSTGFSIMTDALTVERSTHKDLAFCIQYYSGPTTAL